MANVDVILSIASLFILALPKFLPKKAYISKAIKKLGIVVFNMCLTWSNNPASAVAAARFVLSERGDNLSPKEAPVTTAPATNGAGIPIPTPIPIAAVPIVPAVVHALPVDTLIIAHIIGKIIKNILGVNNFKP